ncbi:Ppx/GppA phosphatase family protein [Capillimicrobium parvum]|uniref:Exopolyphosphatase n=1 Tax=Capillimicrobium parvum TaxID=2884022 RepID=A0A9E6XT52_9ACTN|nr:Ppx/GppA phosphatase family protein [Capillimicrobium parvum]UGS34097.1 Exopolyphosphatase [Capillimicrobium parvum]
MTRTAVADLGSNSFRLVVFSAENGWWKRTDEIFESVRIGAGLAQTGELAPDRMQRGWSVAEVFDHFCRATRVDEVIAVATSAIRDAANGGAFAERAALPVRILSRDEEARYGYLAAVNSTTLSDGAVLDLGGGSVQLVAVEDRHARELGSWPLGAVRMTERFLADGEPASGKQLRAVRRHVAEALADAPWVPESGRRLVGIGGTVRNLAAAAAAASEQPSMGVQGFHLTSDALGALVDQLAALPAVERGKVSGIKPARGDLILAGAVVVQAIVEHGGFDGVEVTEAGLREGIFFERHLAFRDPPLFEDVRRASVENLAAQYHVDDAHTRHVARLTLSMFDELAALGIHPGDPAERELLWAAAMLHDIGMAIDYDDHHKHSRYLILNGALPGFSPREMVIVAEIARYHRKGMPSFSSDVARAVREGDDKLLDRGATLLRLAEGLERSRDQIVRTAEVTQDDGQVTLTLRADDPVSVARWAAERERDLFRRAFGRELEIR